MPQGSSFFFFFFLILSPSAWSRPRRSLHTNPPTGVSAHQQSVSVIHFLFSSLLFLSLVLPSRNHSHLPPSSLPFLSFLSFFLPPIFLSSFLLFLLPSFLPSHLSFPSPARHPPSTLHLFFPYPSSGFPFSKCCPPVAFMTSLLKLCPPLAFLPSFYSQVLPTFFLPPSAACKTPSFFDANSQAAAGVTLGLLRPLGVLDTLRQDSPLPQARVDHLAKLFQPSRLSLPPSLHP